MLKTTSNEVPKWEKGDVERNEKKHSQYCRYKRAC